MSYLVLARKWRPQRFSQVIGQEHVTSTLQNAIKSGRVAHALLFSGPRGVGKTTVARIMAKALNCQAGPAAEPCNQCSLCNQITNGTAVDINEIDGASNRGIDEIRQLREGIQFQPVQARYRVYIIDEVHMLTREAFNAMLKTLEEPPPHAFFIMATTEPRKVPETIHSRCQHYEFRRVSTGRLSAFLQEIVEKEGLGLSSEAVRLIATEAGGSVRDSLSLMDQVAAFGASDIDDVCRVLGLVSSRVLRRFASLLFARDVAGVLDLVAEIHSSGTDIPRFVSDLSRFLRDLSVIRRLGASSSSSLVEMDPEEILSLEKEFSSLSFPMVLEALNMVMDATDQIHRSHDQKLALELLSMRLCSLAEMDDLDTLLAKVAEALEKGGLSRDAISSNKALGKDPVQPDTALPEGAGALREKVQRISCEDDSGKSAQGSRQDHALKPHKRPSVATAGKSARPSGRTGADLMDRPGHTDDKGGAGKSDPSKGEQAAGETEAISSSSISRKDWEGFLRWAMERRPSLVSALEQADHVSLKEKNSVLISCSGLCHDILADSGNLALLNRLFSEYLGRSCTIRMKSAQADTAGLPENQEDAKTKGASNQAGKAQNRGFAISKRERVINAPLVQDALELFQARISGVTLYNNRKNRKSTR